MSEEETKTDVVEETPVVEEDKGEEVAEQSVNSVLSGKVMFFDKWA